MKILLYTIYNFYFHIQDVVAVSDGMSERDSAMLSQKIGIGIGVTLTFTLIFFGMLTLYLWRRKWKQPCAEKTEDAASSNPALITSSGRTGEGTVIDSADKYSTSYDVLRINEIGIAAPYSDLGNYGDVRGIKSGKDSTSYDVLRINEIGIAAPYSDFGNYGDVRGIKSGKGPSNPFMYPFIQLSVGLLVVDISAY